MSNVLDQFFAQDELESKFSLTDIVKHATETYGFDIRNSYCLHTGKPIGRTFDSEMSFALAEEASDDLDELTDAMVVRVVASMRPSITLNKPDHVTLRNLASKHPVDVIAFLINRLNGHKELLTKRHGAHSFSPLLERIQTHARWTYLAAKGVDLKPWTHWLLELDAKMNLHDLVSPKISLDRKNNWIIGNGGTPIFSMVTEDNHKALFTHFEKWAFTHMGVYESERHRESLQHSWHRGNRLTVPAYTRSWIENPDIARRATDASYKHQAKNVGRPKTEATVKKESKLSGALLLLDSLSGSVAHVDSEAAKIAKAVGTPKLKLNLNLLKKKGA